MKIRIFRIGQNFKNYRIHRIINSGNSEIQKILIEIQEILLEIQRIQI